MTMAKLWLLLLMAFATSMAVEGARILAFVPFPAKSHQRVIQPLLKELAIRGHQVVCYTPHPLENPPKNYQAVILPDFMPEMKKMVPNANKGNQVYTQWKSMFSILVMVMFKGLGMLFSDWAFSVKEVQDLLQSNETFDAVVLETTFFQENFIALGHKFKAPVIEFLPAGNILWSYWLHGSPTDTSYIAEGLLACTDQMTFTERLLNTFYSNLFKGVWYNYYMPLYQKSMDKYLRYEGWESRPPMMDMIANTSLVLVNTHFTLNYPYPYATHVKEVGGLNIVPPKPLPKDLQDFMDGAKDGVIYFTLGSHIEVSGVLGEELKTTFAKVFGELKQRVLWKWETEFTNLPSNIRISKWFPQQDILAHKNIKLFITHGGFLSTTEAVYQGVPTIGIPLMADQFRNVKHMEHNKYGLLLDLENITYASLKWSIYEILNNPEYGQNAKIQSKLFRDKPETALETAVFWTEYVIRHNGAHHLKPAIATMPWYQQALIDVYLTLAIIILIPLFIFYKIICCSFRLISRLGRKKEIKKDNNKKKLKKTQ